MFLFQLFVAEHKEEDFLSVLSFLDRMIYYDSIKVYDVSKHIITDVFVEKRKYKTLKFQVSRSSSLFIQSPSTYEVVSL